MEGLRGPTGKRLDYLTWDEYFMGIAVLSAQRSKDPRTQVGCVLVDERHRIRGIGYNGLPTGCDDDAFPWGADGSPRSETKYPYVVHAEANCVINSYKRSTGCTAYVSLFPCNECAKLMIQAGVKEVVYLSDKYHSSDFSVAARRLFDSVGIPCRQLIGCRPTIALCLAVDGGNVTEL